MKYLIILSLLILPACSNVSRSLNNIPNAEFKTFEYHRAGNFSSADIVVNGAKIDGKLIKFDEVRITEDWGPFFNISVKIEEYQREKTNNFNY